MDEDSKTRLSNPDKSPIRPFALKGVDSSSEFLQSMMVALLLGYCALALLLVLGIFAGSSSFAPASARNSLLLHLLPISVWIAYIPWAVLRRARAIGPLATALCLLAPVSVLLDPMAIIYGPLDLLSFFVWPSLSLSLLWLALPPGRAPDGEPARRSPVWGLRWAGTVLLGAFMGWEIVSELAEYMT